MGFFTNLFSGGGERNTDGSREPSVKVREKNADLSVVRGDKFTHTSGGGHVHESYSLDKTSGDYKEYRGGENSSDRNYNK